MKIKNRAPAVAVVLGIVLLMLSGCAGHSRPARFYVLNSVAGDGLKIRKPARQGEEIGIGISEVTLPKYLRKPQIVTRTGNNELDLAEYHRWAGRMAEDIGRVIAENLARLLNIDRVLSYPAPGAFDQDYTVEIIIARFDGPLGGEVELIARWAVFDGNGETLSNFVTTHVKEPTGDGGYDHLVAAQSRALAALSREIATVMEELTGA